MACNDARHRGLCDLFVIELHSVFILRKHFLFMTNTMDWRHISGVHQTSIEMDAITKRLGFQMNSGLDFLQLTRDGEEPVKITASKLGVTSTDYRVLSQLRENFDFSAKLVYIHDRWSYALEVDRKHKTQRGF